MPRFGISSLRELETVHPDLRRVLERAIREYDFRVLEGHRGQSKQEAAVAAGKSKAQFGASAHNYRPALAVDCVPWHPDPPHIRWDDICSFCMMATHILAAASELGVRLEWGGHWRKLRDYPHFEIIGWREIAGDPVP